MDQAKVIWHTALSLDGFITGPDEALDWVFENGSPTGLADRVMESAGSILMGRRTFGYEPSREETSGAFGGRWSGRQYVLTHRPEGLEGGPVEVLSCSVEQAVETALQGADGKNALIFGANLAGQCLQWGLIDEIVVHVSPVLLGDGTRFYDVPGGREVRLERLELGEGDQVTDLRLRVR